MVYAQEKKVDKDDNPLDYWYFISFKTILGPLSVELIFRTYCMPPVLQISDFGRSDRQCHHRYDNCIIIPRKCKSEDLEGVLLASANRRIILRIKTG